MYMYMYVYIHIYITRMTSFSEYIGKFVRTARIERRTLSPLVS